MVDRTLAPEQVSGNRMGHQRQDIQSTANAQMVEFDMEFVHKIELRDERPRIPKRREGMSERFFSQLCDRAYQVAAEAKVANYVERGLIEIVSDPFRGESEIEEWAELAALHRPEPANTTEIKVRKLAS
jgi:hypothetical protein